MLRSCALAQSVVERNASARMHIAADSLHDALALSIAPTP
jgi:hypothetical protein